MTSYGQDGRDSISGRCKNFYPTIITKPVPPMGAIQAKRPMRKLKCKWEKNIQMDLKGVRYENVHEF